ncbi:MAG: S41 family peptidase [Lachnospiraceae bacterium]|nr:S41 family peptidase [Lachnospiraceae bacterium]
MKDKKFLKGFLAGLLSMMACVLLICVVLVGTGRMNPGNLFADSGSIVNNRLNGKMTEIQRYIDKYFLDDIDESKMQDSICKGMVDGLGDTYAAYYNEDEYKDMQEKTSGNYCGIGAYVSQSATDGAISVVQPIKDSPAEKVGLKSGDVISEVDGKSIEGMDLTAVVSKMKGEAGTKVKITVIRKNHKKEFTIVREEIHSQTVASEMLDNKIGYIAVSSFEEVTKQQFRDALEKLENEGEKSLIIDLRNNGGGLLSTAVDMLDRMLPEGVVVYTKDKEGNKEEYSSTAKESFDKPVVILVNENSASASEVFSGAMQDYKKGTLVGTTTFGKGIVQTVFNLQDGTALKLTTSKYYTPKGRNIHGTGLKPDISVALDQKTFTQKKSGIVIDNQMKAAVDYLQKK